VILDHRPGHDAGVMDPGPPAVNSPEESSAGDPAGVAHLAQVREAYTELERRHTRGKIVLRP
jgi:hypothetical protein